MALPASLEGQLRLPLIGAPMFIVSGPELVAAQCKAGIVGSFPALNARPQEKLVEWIQQIKADLAAHAEQHPDEPVAPFAVNQIVHPSNPRLLEDMQVCVEEQVPIIITSLSPPGEIVQAVHSYGGLVFHDIINLRHARKGAGGHAGPLSPFALVGELRKEYDGCLILSGCISRGDDVLAAAAMGADLAYSGTRFIASHEAQAVPGYKEMIVDSTAGDIVNSSLFTGVQGNYLAGSIAAVGMDPANLPEGKKEDMDFTKASELDAKAWKDIWGAGQGVGNIDDIRPARDVVLRMEQEYRDALARVNA
jgi:nitronate monooxygenase